MSATIYHVMRDAMSAAAITLALFVKANFVAYMRWRVLPFQLRRDVMVRGGVS